MAYFGLSTLEEFKEEDNFDDYAERIEHFMIASKITEANQK
jgi:hypothetical protein